MGQKRSCNYSNEYIPINLRGGRKSLGLSGPGNARVAQSVERKTLNLVVASSSLASGLVFTLADLVSVVTHEWVRIPILFTYLLQMSAFPAAAMQTIQ